MGREIRVEPRRPDPGGYAECRDIVRIYRGAEGEIHALRGVGAHFGSGTVTVVAGPSGGGKSTLLSILALRDRPSAGELTLDGVDVTDLSAGSAAQIRRRSVAWVPQRAAHGLLGHLTALENVEQMRRLRSAAGADLVDGAPTAREALDLVGLSDLVAVRPARMSGGEQQRLAVAGAVVGAPRFLIADEPTAELDDDNAVRVVDALAATAQLGTTCVLSSHDERILSRIPRVLHLRHGVLSAERADLVETGPGGFSATEPGDAVIDAAGRLQLPPEALRLFAAGRARVEIDGETVVLRPPRAMPRGEER